MKYKLGWISWVTISLMALSIAFAVFAFTTKLQVIRDMDNYSLSLIIISPIILFGIAVCASIFKRIGADKKNYWLLDDICTRSYFLIFFMYIIGLLLPLFIHKAILEYASFASEVLLLMIAFLVCYIVSGNMFMKILYNTKRNIRIQLWCIVFGIFLGALNILIIQVKDARFFYFLISLNSLSIILTMVFILFLNNKVLEIPYKFMVWGFVGASVLAILSRFISPNLPLCVYTITTLGIINIATDINLSLNPKENAIKLENKWRQDEK